MTPDLILNPGENIKPDFTVDEAKEFVYEIFGLNCLKIVELNGYDDKNYKVDVEVGGCVNNAFWEGLVSADGYILKIMNSLDSKNLGFVEGCNSLLQFLGEYFIKVYWLILMQ